MILKLLCNESARTQITVSYGLSLWTYPMCTYQVGVRGSGAIISLPVGRCVLRRLKINEIASSHCVEVAITSQLGRYTSCATCLLDIGSHDVAALA